MKNTYKKCIGQLRQEMIDAEDQFSSLYLFCDHIQFSLQHNIENFEQKKWKLKWYIQKNFDHVINVDLLEEYIVVWHYTTLFDEGHKQYQPPLTFHPTGSLK